MPESGISDDMSEAEYQGYDQIGEYLPDRERIEALVAEVERLHEQLALRDDSLANRRVRQLREALREAIGWSYGDGPTPERRDELEALL